MKRLLCVLSILGFLTLFISYQGVFAGSAGEPRPAPGKPNKLGVPANVVCTKTNDQLMVMWDPVMGAAHYRVMLEADEDADLVETVDSAPYSHALSDLTDDPNVPVTVKVKAMQSQHGKGASKPSTSVTCQAGTITTPTLTPKP